MGWIRKQLGIEDAKRAQRDAENLANEQRAEEEAAKKRIEAGKLSINKTLSRFDDKHFQGVQDDYMNFGKTQLDQQVAKGRNDITMHLARNGILNSSAKNASEADLQSQYGRGIQDITAKGNDMVMGQRDALETYRSQLLNTLQATADNNLVSQQAMTRANMLAEPDVYSPFTDMISTGTAALGNQLQLERASKEYGGADPTFWSGAFGARGGSSTVNRR